jgi:hypothetical protein
LKITIKSGQQGFLILVEWNILVVRVYIGFFLILVFYMDNAQKSVEQTTDLYQSQLKEYQPANKNSQGR